MQKLKNKRPERILILFALAIISMSVHVTKASVPADPAAKRADDRGKVFIVNAPIRDIAEFRKLVIQAARLKPYGEVQVNISALAGGGFHEVPEGNNFWHQYASYNATLFKFFPDPAIAPFIPADFVKRNREYLLARARILREYGINAEFWCNEPNFLPDAFFDRYPGLRGPRVDHPRRGNHPAFSLCMDLEQSRKMVAGMIEELLKNVPEIRTFVFKTNDAGSGICWSDWQYSGPNGPSRCRGISMGRRVASLMELFNEGAKKTGNELTIYLAESMFSDEEMTDILKYLPANCHALGTDSDNSISIGSNISGYYPVRGLLDPVDLLRKIDQMKDDRYKTVFINFKSYYDRGYELMPVIEKVIDLITDNMGQPAVEGEIARMLQVEDLCRKWAGDRESKKLFDAIMLLEDAKKYKNSAVGNVTGIYWGVSTRHINRPLVFAPQLLTREEEAYFLPYVFNPSTEEARMDYTDIHGSHNSVPSGVIPRYVSMIVRAAGLMEGIGKDIPESMFIQTWARALRLHAGIMRSAGNFAEAQAIRDRNADKLSRPPHRPGKEPTWDGDPDLQAFNTVMRDELDNAGELIELLSGGGTDILCHASDPAQEDTFLLGPGLIRQLKLKQKIMLAHWTDIEGYLATPFK
ncbi:MAG TPA: hypothetical protein PLS58_03255 [Bacteroidales bacterium]|nr:hypothetical protein [Bacteroidales bacterium]